MTALRDLARFIALCLLDAVLIAIVFGIGIAAAHLPDLTQGRTLMPVDFNERHARKGIMTNQPDRKQDWSYPHASTTVCDRPECQEKARFWVQGMTGEPAVYVPDAKR